MGNYIHGPSKEYEAFARTILAKLKAGQYLNAAYEDIDRHMLAIYLEKK